uniref:Uncharacterized protein n=1 Tax=Oryzias latipes TaxID=8090 RepID=A0A3P9MA30_ORYLA
FAQCPSAPTHVSRNHEYLKGYEFQLQENTDAVKQVKESVDANTAAVKSVVEDVNRLKLQMVSLQKENASLLEMCLEHKEGEITPDETLKILSKVMSVNVEELRHSVATVHRLGQKGKNNQPRQIIIQFGMRVVRDQVWRMSKNAKICKDLNVRFKEDFCKEDRETRQHPCISSLAVLLPSCQAAPSPTSFYQYIHYPSSEHVQTISVWLL